ncbi:MAG: hypothetical protein V3S71_02720 [Acidobacteriota bacterium]
MSSYFDSAQRVARQSYEDLVAAEEQVFKDVTYVTGDREFPDDLREKILGVMAVEFAWHPSGVPQNERAVEYVKMMSYSRGIESVHSLFHELARRDIWTRFGRLSDSPTQIRHLRDEHDSE